MHQLWRHCSLANLLGLNEDEAEEVGIVVYVNPHTIANNDRWRHTFEKLAERGLISLIYIDEAHCVDWGQQLLPDDQTAGPARY